MFKVLVFLSLLLSSNLIKAWITYKVNVEKLAVLQEKALHRLLFYVKVYELNKQDIKYAFVVRSSRSSNRSARESRRVLYCHDDERRTFMAIREDDLIITTGFRITTDKTIIEFSCNKDICKLMERSLPTYAASYDLFDHFLLERYIAKRSLADELVGNNFPKSAYNNQTFYVSLLVMIDSETVIELCRRQYPNCCQKPITTTNLCQNIRDYYLNMVNALRQLFANIDSEQIHIDLSLVDLQVIPQIKNKSYFHNYTDNTENGLVLKLTEAITAALTLSSKAQGQKEQTFAATIAFVGHDIQGKNGLTTIGGAFPASACTKYKIGLVEERFGYISFFTLAHELGHIFGSEHDGVYADCGSTTNMLMGWTFNKDNPELAFVFSCCSLSQIYNHLLSAQCVLKPYATGNDPLLPLADEKKLGELLTPDEFCAFTEGSGHQTCFYHNEADVCKGVPCIGSSRRSKCRVSKSTPVLNGMPCRDSEHWCLYGECVRKTLKANFSSELQHNCDVTHIPRQHTQPKEKTKPFYASYGGWIKLLLVISGYCSFVVGLVSFVQKKIGIRKPSNKVVPDEVEKEGQLTNK